MKYLLALAVLCLTACGPSPAPAPIKPAVVQSPQPVNDGCTVNSASKLMTQHVVGPITNLIKVTEENGVEGKCTVKFDIVVDGKSHHLEETETGYEQLASLCYYARERAREDLLLDLGGEFQSESEVTCKFNEK